MSMVSIAWLVLIFSNFLKNKMAATAIFFADSEY